MVYRKNKLHVYCPKNPRHKQRQGFHTCVSCACSPAASASASLPISPINTLSSFYSSSSSSSFSSSMSSPSSLSLLSSSLPHQMYTAASSYSSVLSYLPGVRPLSFISPIMRSPVSVSAAVKQQLFSSASIKVELPSSKQHIEIDVPGLMFNNNAIPLSAVGYRKKSIVDDVFLEAFASTKL